MPRIGHIGCSVMVLGMFAESDERQPRSRCCAAAGHCHAWIAGAEESYGLITESTSKWVSVQPGITPHDFPYHLLAQLPTGGLVGFVMCEMLVGVRKCQKRRSMGWHCDLGAERVGRDDKCGSNAEGNRLCSLAVIMPQVC